MFESVRTIHWLKKEPLAIVWIAAQLDRESEQRSKLNRRRCVKVNISEACEMLISPEVPVSLCLCSRLMLGIVRIHQRQTHFAWIDCEYLKRRYEVFSGMSFDCCQARHDQITFPEPDFNASFSSVSELHISKLLSSSPMAGFFQMDLELDRSLILSEIPSSPPPRSGSINGTPTSECSYTANPKDISIDDIGEPKECLLEISLMDSMYFGDEDPMLATSENNDSFPKLVDDSIQSQPMKQDQVLLFDDQSNTFSFSDGGGAADISSSVMLSPPSPGKNTTHRFESPFVNLKKSQTGATVLLSATTSTFATKTDQLPHELALHREDYLQPNNILHSIKKESRKRKKFCPVDSEISLHRHDMKAGSSNVKVLTRTVNLRAEVLPKPKPHKPKDLLFQMYTEADNHLKLSKSLLQPSLVLEKTTTCDFTLQPMEMKTPLGTPILRTETSGSSTSQSIDSELEVVRGGHQSDNISYDNPVMSNASSISGDTTIKSSGGHSFHMSTMLRLKAEGKDTRNVPPLITVGLSPIMDIDEDLRGLSGTGVGAMPSLNDSIDYLEHSSLPQHSQLSSPSIEHNPKIFADKVMSRLESRQQVDFRELLPKESTRKTAGVAFHHILTMLSNTSQLTVKQSIPYGPIILRSHLSL